MNCPSRGKQTYFKAPVTSKGKFVELHRTTREMDHVFQPGDQVLLWMEKQVNNSTGTYRGPFIALSIDADSKIVIIEKEPGKAPKIYNAA